MAAVSLSQAACNALQRWLKSSLSSDIRVFARWAPPDVRFGTRNARKVVTIVRVGRRTRSAAFGVFTVLPPGAATLGNPGRINLSATSAQVDFQIGSITQPVQLDVWATSEDDRDDVVAQLDGALYAGMSATMNIANSTQTVTGDPIRDGVLLPMLDGFQGNNCDFVFDDVSFDDSPESVQRREYRATYLGEAQMAQTVRQVVPRLIAIQADVQTYEAPKAPVGGIYNTATIVAPFGTRRAQRGTTTIPGH